ncbi:hypothetical protein Efla_006653 [Eimeria flavescens]
MEPPEGPPLDEQITEAKRKLRLITQAAKTFGDAAQVQLRKQRSAIEKLNVENASLKRELQQAKEALSQQQNTLLSAVMQGLNEQCKNLLREIAEEKKEEQFLQGNINVVEGRVRNCRQRLGSLGGVYAAEVTSEAIQRQTRTLENRLDKALQKYSQATAHNRKLKEEINGLRKERVTFDNLCRKAESDLIAEKKVVLDLVREANQAYTSREEAQKQIAALKASEAKERKSFETEWAHMQQFLESLQMRQWTRAEAQRLADQQGRRAADCEQEAEAKGGDSWSSTEELPSLCDSSTLSSYQAAFAKIQAATGICTVDELISALRVAEEHNFSLFTYVNSLSDEVEAHEAAISSLRSALQMLADSQKALTRKKTDESRAFESQSFALESRMKAIETANADAAEQLITIMQQTKIMFEQVGAKAKHAEALWVREGVDEATITQHLQAVEEAVEELVDRLSRQKAAEPAGAATESGMQKQAAKRIDRSRKNTHQIKLPSAVNRTSSFEVLDDEEAEARPLSREELLNKLQRSKAKRDERERAKVNKSVLRLPERRCFLRWCNFSNLPI